MGSCAWHPMLPSYDLDNPFASLVLSFPDLYNGVKNDIYFRVLLAWSPERLHAMRVAKGAAHMNSSINKRLVLYIHKTLGMPYSKAHSRFCPTCVYKKTCDLVHWADETAV